MNLQCKENNPRQSEGHAEILQLPPYVPPSSVNQIRDVDSHRDFERQKIKDMNLWGFGSLRT